MIEYLLASREQLFTPGVFFLTGVLYAVVSAVLSLILFYSQASIAHILLASVAVAPIIFRAILIGAHVLDEEPRLVLSVQSWLSGLYLSYLLGAILGFQLAYMFVPQPYKDALISEQIRELQALEGVKLKMSGMATKEGVFWTIFINNLRVYVISILLSFFYGTGGILLLNWNASLISALLYLKLTYSVNDAVTSFLSILPHGILEFLGYFMGGISGVLIGVAIIQEGWNTRLLRDVIILVISGILLILLAAVVEAGLI